MNNLDWDWIEASMRLTLTNVQARLEAKRILVEMGDSQPDLPEAIALDERIEALSMAALDRDSGSQLRRTTLFIVSLLALSGNREMQAFVNLQRLN